jgi:hypothetical protein
MFLPRGNVKVPCTAVRPAALTVISAAALLMGAPAAQGRMSTAPLAATPTISSITPSSGAAGILVTIQGTGFTGANAVRFGTTAAAQFVVDSDSELSVVSPTHGPGTVDVSVVTPGGTSALSSADRFTYGAPPPPHITSVTPNSGPNTGGTPVTIQGSGLTGATAVAFGTIPAASYAVVSDTKITATSPAGANGAVDITVTTSAGKSAMSTADRFTYQKTTAWTATTNPTAVAPGGQVTYITDAPSGTAAGLVTFHVGTQTLCTTPLNTSADTASCSATTAPTGTDSITVGYGASAPGTPETTTTLTVAAPTWSLTVNPQTVLAGSTVTVTATASTVPATAMNINFTVNGGSICSATLVGTKATCQHNTNAAVPGTDTVKARASIGGTVTTLATASLTVLPPVWSLSVSPTPAVQGQATTYTATEIGFVKTPNVSFVQGSTALCTGAFGGGTAKCTSSIALPISNSVTISATIGNPPVVVGTTTIQVVPAPLQIVAPFTTPVIGVPYSVTVFAKGGEPPFTYSVSSGALPAGLTLNSSSGVISGTPTQIGPATFTLKVTDSYTPTETATHTYTLTVMPQPLVITTSSPLPTGAETTPGTPYTETLSVTGGVTPYGFAVTSGALPGGLSLDSTTGQVSGTPTSDGIFTFTITATDSCPVSTCGGPEQTPKAFSLEVTGPARAATFQSATYTPGAQETLKFTDNTDGESAIGGYELMREVQGRDQTYTQIATAGAVAGKGGTVTLVDTLPISQQPAGAAQTDCYIARVVKPDQTTADSLPVCETLSLPKPSGLTLAARSTNYLTVNFTNPSTATSWKAIACQGSTCVPNPPVTGTGTGAQSASITGLSKYTTYTVKIAACFSAASSCSAYTTISLTTDTTVPNVLGKLLANAEAILSNAGLTANPNASIGLVNGESVFGLTSAQTVGKIVPPGTTVALDMVEGYSAIFVDYEFCNSNINNWYLYDESTGTASLINGLGCGTSTTVTGLQNNHHYDVEGWFGTFNDGQIIDESGSILGETDGPTASVCFC